VVLNKEAKMEDFEECDLCGAREAVFTLADGSAACEDCFEALSETDQEEEW
jgi:hypothetical protein